MNTAMLASTSALSLRPVFAGSRALRSAQPSAPRRAFTGPVRVNAFREDDKTYKVDPTEQGVVPAFTRRRERIVGRLAMLGVAFAWAGEQLTGLGPLTQISNETGVPMQYVYGATVFLAATQLILGVNQFSPTYDEANQRDVNKRKKGITGITAIEPDVEGRIKITEQPGKFFLRNELVLGRSAMLIFASACVLEYIWRGESPLAHVGLITPGGPISSAPLLLKIAGSIFFIGGLGIFSGFDQNKDDDTY